MTQSPPRRGRSEQSRRRRQEILDAALEEFGARGYHAVSMTDIASAVGVTKPVVYLVFPSKDELFTATVMEAGQRLAGAVRRHRLRWTGANRTCIALFEGLHDILAVEMPEAVEVIAAARWVSVEAAAAGGAASAALREELRLVIARCLPVTPARAGVVADVLTAEAIAQGTVHAPTPGPPAWEPADPADAADAGAPESITSRLPCLLATTGGECALAGSW